MTASFEPVGADTVHAGMFSHARKPSLLLKLEPRPPAPDPPEAAQPSHVRAQGASGGGGAQTRCPGRTLPAAPPRVARGGSGSPTWTPSGAAAARSERCSPISELCPDPEAAVWPRRDRSTALKCGVFSGTSSDGTRARVARGLGRETPFTLPSVSRDEPALTPGAGAHRPASAVR